MADMTAEEVQAIVANAAKLARDQADHYWLGVIAKNNTDHQRMTVAVSRRVEHATKLMMWTSLALAVSLGVNVALLVALITR